MNRRDASMMSHQKEVVYIAETGCSAGVWSLVEIYSKNRPSMQYMQYNIPSLKLTVSLPLKNRPKRPKRKPDRLPSIHFFGCYVTVSFREGS